MLLELDIANGIMSYSYERGDDAYLQKNCDMGALCTAMRAKVQAKALPRYVDRNSRIRG